MGLVSGEPSTTELSDNETVPKYCKLELKLGVSFTYSEEVNSFNSPFVLILNIVSRFFLVLT